MNTLEKNLKLAELEFYYASMRLGYAILAKYPRIVIAGLYYQLGEYREKMAVAKFNVMCGV